LAVRAKSIGISVQLSEALKVDVDAIEDSIREFVSYWTIGGGMGQKRRHWMRKAREHVRKNAGRPGGLAAPGALEHRQRNGRTQEVSPNLDHDTRERLEASRKVREMLAFSDRMKAGPQ
jgi:hypothetical protein